MWLFSPQLSICSVAPIGFDPVAPGWMYGDPDGPEGGGFKLRDDRIGDFDVEVWDKAGGVLRGCAPLVVVLLPHCRAGGRGGGAQ